VPRECGAQPIVGSARREGERCPSWLSSLPQLQRGGCGISAKIVTNHPTLDGGRILRRKLSRLRKVRVSRPSAGDHYDDLGTTSSAQPQRLVTTSSELIHSQ